MYKLYSDSELEQSAKIREEVQLLPTHEFINPDNFSRFFSEKSAFFLKNKELIYNLKFNTTTNPIPIIYTGNDNISTGHEPDLHITDFNGIINDINMWLGSYWKKRKQLKSELRLVIENTRDKVSQLLNDVYNFIKVFFDLDEGLFIKLAIDEALINAYKHGNKMDDNKFIYFELKYFGYKIEVTVKDEGDGFNVADVYEKECDFYSPDGRGIKLIRELMDETIFKYKGNIITMVKYINQGEQ